MARARALTQVLEVEQNLPWAGKSRDNVAAEAETGRASNRDATVRPGEEPLLRGSVHKDQTVARTHQYKPVAGNIKGIAAMVAATALFTLGDASMKLVSGSLPTGETVFVRSLCTVILTTAAALATGAIVSLKRALVPAIGWRSVGDVGASLSFPKRPCPHAVRRHHRCPADDAIESDGCFRRVSRRARGMAALDRRFDRPGRGPADHQAGI
jgi:hypothetical protein